MKNNKGIVLSSLVIYIIVMVIVVCVVGSIITQFYQNINALEADTEEISEFNHFNTYFLKEVKQRGNKIDEVKGSYILFHSGNSFSYMNDQIYYNNISICKKVKNFAVEATQDEKGNYADTVTVTVTFENFKKSMQYKLEEIN